MIVAILSLVSLAASLFVFYYIFDDFLIYINSIIIPIVLRLLFPVLIYVFLWNIIFGYTPKRMINFVGIAYTLVLGSIILFKSTGIKGFNINPLTLIFDFSQNPYLVLANLLSFIPVGLSIRFMMNQQKAGFIISLGFAASAALEMIQYLFSMGIADINDVLLNGTGFMLGVLGASLLQKRLSLVNTLNNLP